MASNIFNSVRLPKHKSNVFDLSHENKLTTEFGRLTPILCLECLPGDKFRVNTEIFLRFAPMLAPIMHRVNVYTHFFFVPNRLVWDNWEDFITGGPDGLAEPLFPKFLFNSDVTANILPRSLADYLGVNLGQNTAQFADNAQIVVSQLPFRAYQLIYNEYYRDQNLEDELNIKKDFDGLYSGPYDGGEEPGTPARDFVDLLVLRNRCWEKDYFTSALPWTQRGPEMKVPLTGNLPIEWTSNGVRHGDRMMQYNAFNNTWSMNDDPNEQGVVGGTRPGSPMGYLSTGDIQDPDVPYPYKTVRSLSIDNSSHLSANLDSAAAITLNELRKVTAIQSWLENNARAGSRYVEQLLSHFGIYPQDARLQRPEFLGGGKSPVMISEVLQQSQSTETSPQGTMAGHAVAGDARHAFTYSCKEHGYIIGIMSVMPRSGYMQGIPRHFLKYDKFMYGWPELANLGEQEILNQELYSSIDREGVFGYTPRYAEYKFHNDEVHGDFKTNLDYWHLARKFSSQPALNADFVHVDDTNLNRIFNFTGDSDHIWSQIYFNIRSIRQLPKYGTPRL